MPNALSPQNRLWVWLTHLHLLPFCPILFRQKLFFFKVNHASDTWIHSGVLITIKPKKVNVRGDMPHLPTDSLFSAWCDTFQTLYHGVNTDFGARGANGTRPPHAYVAYAISQLLFAMRLCLPRLLHFRLCHPFTCCRVFHNSTTEPPLR